MLISGINLRGGTYYAAGAFAPSTDPYFYATTLLLPGNGANGAQNNTFVDGSTNNFAITRNGNTTQGTYSPYAAADGYWGAYFDGTGDYLTVPDSTTFDLTNDYTIEFWWYPTDLSDSSNLFGLGDERAGNNGITIYWRSASSAIAFYVNGASIIISSIATPANAWYHIAISRNGSGSNNTKLYINGTEAGTTTNTTSFTGVAGNGVCVGAAYSGTYAAMKAGYISNLRIVKGTAVYTSNFTPSTTPLTSIANTSLLTCQSNRFKDNSSNNFAITVAGDTRVTNFGPFNPTAAYTAATNGGSAYFDGTGDYLTAGQQSAFSFGTGDFTVEAWVFNLAFSNYNVLLDTRISSVDASGIVFGFNASKNLYAYSGSSFIFQVGTAVLNAWNHIAFVRNNGVLTAYLNGTSVGSASVSTDFTSNNSVIGKTNESGSNYLNGYISNLRIVKGTAVYTTNFTPPTAPVTAIANTSLLLNSTNAGITDATTHNVLETVGDAKISTAQSKWGGSSIAFDGTGDILAVPNSNYYDFSNGDFTVEFWYRTNTLTPTGPGVAGYGYIIGQTNWNGNNAGNGWCLFQYNQAINFYYPGATLSSVGTGNVITSTSVWYHIAIVRSGTATNNTKIYVDGVQQAQGTPTITNSTKPLVIGGINTTYGWDNTYTTNGYINDLRITRGIARYTTNFTPPDAAFFTY